MPDTNPIVLVLCTGNSCRSQMAEGFLRHFRGREFDAHSAGTEPKNEVHPLAVRVMKEAGVDITAQRPKTIDSFLGKLPVRHLIIVCDHANSACPRAWPGTFTRDFLPFEDPAHFEGTEEQKLAGFRRVRDQIAEAMKAWQPQRSRA